MYSSISRLLGNQTTSGLVQNDIEAIETTTTQLEADVDALETSVASLSGLSGLGTHITTSGTTLNVGTTASTSTINIGGSGDTITLNGNITSVNTATLLANTMDVSTGSTLNIGTGVSTSTINIGTGAGTNTINIGGTGDNVNVAGTLTTINTTNLEVADKTITLNDGGLASSGADAGILIEENGIATGKIVVDSFRAGFLLQAPSMYHATPDLYHVRISSEGIDWKNMNTASISTYYPDDATRRVKFYLDSIGGTTAGATLLTQRDYADLKLNANNASKTGMVRYETRTANMGSSANTNGEIQVRDHADVRCASFGSAVSVISSTDVSVSGTLSSGSFVAGTTTLGATTLGTLSSNSINMTPYTTTITGTWDGVRSTGSYTINLKRIGDIVFINIPSIGETNATTGGEVFTFSVVAPVEYRPAIREKAYCEITTLSDGINTKAGTIIITSTGTLIVNASAGVLFTTGQASGWAWPIQFSYRIV